MILTVTLNLALDVTYAVPGVTWGDANRVTEAAGGESPGPGAPTESLRAAQRLRRAGADAVVVSLGADGLLGVTGEECWVARPPEAVRGNPTGAGDAVVAALAAGLVAGAPWPDRLADAAALSAAAVHAPVAGSFDAAAYARYRAERLR